MPQKKNYDVLNWFAETSACLMAIKIKSKRIIKNLPSGYDRRSSLTKGPYMQGVKLALDTIEVMTLVIKNLGLKENLENACTS